tara:strand:+ start:1941 stop:2732 length:792 start_codon:yes stop_codon:yes gene_type:complete
MAAVTSSIVGIASGVMGAGMSFAQKNAAAVASSQAKQDSKRLMSEAKQMAEKDFYAELNVPMGAFERQREENTAAGSMAVQALQEGDARGLAGGVGAVNQAQTVASEGLRNDLGQALYDNNKMKADSKQAINQQLISANLGQAKDAEAEASYQDKVGKQAMMSGVESALGAVGSAANLVPLYGSKAQGRRGAKLLGNDKVAQGFKDKGIGAARATQMLGGLSKKQQKDILGGGSFDFDTLFGKGFTNKKGMTLYEGEEGFFKK